MWLNELWNRLFGHENIKVKEKLNTTSDLLKVNGNQKLVLNDPVNAT